MWGYVVAVDGVPWHALHLAAAAGGKREISCRMGFRWREDRSTVDCAGRINADHGDGTSVNGSIVDLWSIANRRLRRSPACGCYLSPFYARGQSDLINRRTPETRSVFRLAADRSYDSLDSVGPRSEMEAIAKSGTRT